jgi:hypothetical protein
MRIRIAVLRGKGQFLSVVVGLVKLDPAYDAEWERQAKRPD